MNKKAWYTFRIVLGGYLAWLGIRMLIEMVNEKPNNMVFMCVMSVIFILIGLAYAIYYVKKMFDLKKEDHRIEEEDKEAFDAGKDQADRKRRKNVLPEIGPNEEMKKEAEQGKTDKETLFTSEDVAMVTFEEFKIFCESYGVNAYKEAEKLDDKAEGETEKSGYKAGSETEQSDDKVKKEAEKPNDKNEEDAEDEMIKEGGKNQEPELAMEEFIEETETEIENDYEER